MYGQDSHFRTSPLPGKWTDLEKMDLWTQSICFFHTWALMKTTVLEKNTNTSIFQVGYPTICNHMLAQAPVFAPHLTWPPFLTSLPSPLLPLPAFPPQLLDGVSVHCIGLLHNLPHLPSVQRGTNSHSCAKLSQNGQDLRRYNQCHDLVLGVIVMLKLPPSAQFSADFSDNYNFPLHITSTDLRPDTVGWNDASKKLRMVELTASAFRDCFSGCYREEGNQVKKGPGPQS